MKQTEEILRLRLLRLIHGLTQAELGQQVGVSQTQISRIERGTRRASPGVREKLGQAFGVGIDRLLASEARNAHDGKNPR